MKLAEALRDTANYIKTTNLYSWNYAVTCNCGLLARTLFVVPDHSSKWHDIFDYINECVNDYAREFQSKREMYDPIKGFWSRIKIHPHGTCPITDLPMGNVIRKLREIGMTTEDIEQLEFLSNPNILTRSGIVINNEYYRKSGNVILYMEAWADMLDEQESAPVVRSSVDLEKSSALLVEEMVTI